MIRKFAVGDSLVYCGESAAVRVRVLAPFGFGGSSAGVEEPLYWVAGESGAVVCAESWLESEVA